VRRHRRGFTLVELLLVVSIIALTAALAFNNITVQRERTGIEESLRNIRERVEHVRTLSRRLGPLVGSPGAGATWVYNGCVAPVPGYLWVSINPAGPWNIPRDVIITPPDTVTVNCESGTIQQVTSNAERSTSVRVASAPPLFSFTGTGRVINTGLVNPGPLWVALRRASDMAGTLPHGFRVLPSGLLCGSKGGAGGQLCDTD
jgi:prepilin-type N-terminal cleavage/methylation domain-containing protein